MAGTYEKGQKVSIKRVESQNASSRDSTLGSYAGKIGTIVEVYWINMGAGTQSFNIYTVRLENENKDIVVHEDEIKAYLG
jgi:ribosomal protein L21E